MYIYRLALFAYGVLYQRTNDVCLGPWLSSWISGATVNHANNVSNNVAVVTFTYDVKFSSYLSKCTACIRKNCWSGRDCNACLKASLAIPTLHPALTQIIDISNRRAVIGSVERQDTTCSFRVTSVTMHKMYVVSKSSCVPRLDS